MICGEPGGARPWSSERLSLDIIVPATAMGEAGIASFDLDGPGVFEKLPRIFRRGLSSRRLDAPEGRAVSAGDAGMAIYGRIVSPEGETLDEAILAVHSAAGSPTRRPWATLSAHGGTGVRSAILEALRGTGFAEALPGEMAARAYLAGTVPLVEVERDLRIPLCRTRRQAAALFLSTAWLKERLGRVAMDGLLMLRSGEAAWRAAMAGETDAFLAGASRVRALLRRHDVAVIGPVNAGKSSLINALCGEDRVIVTDIPGTTRDVVRVEMSLNGLSVRVADTAGMRPWPEGIEREGQTLAARAAEEADLVIVLLEGCRPVSEWEKQTLSKAVWRRTLPVVSKADMPAASGEDSAASVASAIWGVPPVRVSAVTGAGLEELKH
ncbi:MAG: 50S ribosome-binding GTPase, partial [Planctomycetota bacterium]|nr:50S ribosome-binding GTPase [Planctomycetota bacterium]